VARVFQLHKRLITFLLSVFSITFVPSLKCLE